MCAAILSVKLGTHVEHFKTGRDGGVDCRYFSINREVIIQCKHWQRSDFGILKSHIRDKEYPKIQKLNPQKYILMTSQDLTRQNKQELKTLLSPFVKSDSDIWGIQDLTDLLDLNEYSNVLRTHYKLWITSMAVMTALLNNDVMGRSHSELENFIATTRRYVETPDRKRAFDKLEAKHSIIITGAPGIGKTTLAEQLCIYYASQAFEIIVISNEIAEAERVYAPEKKQLFYFDDFLGSNYLNAINNKDDSSIVSFMQRIEKDHSKRFILTSRTNILNQGKRLSQCFTTAKIEKNEFEITISNLDLWTKAKILYSHIWHSQLEADFVESLYKNHHYMDIIKHRNYNPRLISYITDNERFGVKSEQDYWAEVERLLENPKDVWNNVFDTQIDDVQRFLVLLVFWNGGTCGEFLLRQAFQTIIPEIQNHLPANLSTRFESNAKTAVGAVLSRTIDLEGNAKYALFDPSIGDYLLNNYLSTLQFTLAPLKALRTLESVNHFLALYQETTMPQSIWDHVFNWYIQSLTTTALPDECKLKIVKFAIQKKLDKSYPKIRNFFRNIDFREFSAKNLNDFNICLRWLGAEDPNYCRKKLYSNEPFICDLCFSSGDIDDLFELFSLLKQILNDEFTRIPNAFYSAIEIAYSDKVYEMAWDYFDASDLKEYNEPREAEQYVKSRLQELISDELFDHDIDEDRIDIAECMAYFNANDFIRDLVEDASIDDIPDYKDIPKGANIDDDIHALFARQ